MTAQDEIATRIGHGFREPRLLREALTHRSAIGGAAGRAGLRRGTGSNERLEFIGDRVLGLLVAEWLLERYPDEQEGELGARHAHLVSREVLVGIAGRFGIEQALALAPDAARAGVASLANVLADTMEAVLGALYLDAGLDAVRVLVRAEWAPAIDAQLSPPKDSKTALQEWMLARGLGLPEYAEISRAGPSHAPSFVIEATGGGQSGSGEAASKRVAERAAAAELLTRLRSAPRSRRNASDPSSRT